MLMSDLDMVSVNVEFFMKDFKKFYTKKGIGLSVIIYILAISSGIYFTINFLSIGKPYVIQSLIQVSELSFKSINEVPIGLRLTDDRGFSILPDGVFTIESTWIETLKNDAGYLTQVYEDLPSISCSLENVPIELREVANVEVLKSFYCTDWLKTKQYNLDNLYGGTLPYTFKGTRFFQCNTVDPLANCRTQQEIDSLLVNSFLEILTVDYNVLSLELVPVIPKLNIYRTPVSNTSFIRVWMSLMQGEYTTDNGIIFENKQTIRYYSISVLKEQFRAIMKEDIENGTVEFASFSIQNSETKSSYLRSFTKLQDAFANFGGIIKALFVLAQVINFLISRKEYWIQLESMLPMSILHSNVNLNSQPKVQNFLNFNNFLSKPSSDMKSLRNSLNTKLKFTLLERILPNFCIKIERRMLFERNCKILKEILSAKSVIETYSMVQALKIKSISNNEVGMFNFIHSAYDSSSNDLNYQKIAVIQSESIKL